MTTRGKRDTTIDWLSQGKPIVQSFTSANTGFTATYREEGHAWIGFAVPSPLFGLGFDDERDWRYPLDLSYPAIQNASGSGPVVPAISGDDDYNMNIQWATAQTVDITPRRTQQFEVYAGQQCTWTTTDNNGAQPDELRNRHRGYRFPRYRHWNHNHAEQRHSTGD